MGQEKPRVRYDRFTEEDPRAFKVVKKDGGRTEDRKPPKNEDQQDKER